MASLLLDRPDTAGEAPGGSRPALRHIAALDGLRGVAVLGVMAFHAGHLRGGFLGVDLFFVLSGFLITGLLVSEWDRTGRVDLVAFWGRRFRRLLPAALVVVAAVSVYGAVALPATELGELRRAGLGTVAYVANWVAIGTGADYWTAFASPSLLEHAWSLAIEEQFYLVWPVVAVVGLGLARGRRWPLALTTTVLALLSVVALWAHHDPGADTARAYYGTDTRAAAILYGALAALALTGRPRRASDRAERILAALLLPAVLVLAAMWATTSGTADSLYGWGFPLAGLTAAVVIAAVSGPRAGAVGRALSHPALEWLGSISYGLYLWHWPVFVVLDESRLGIGGYPLTAARVAVSVGLAVASARLVEQPVRSGSVPHHVWRSAAPVAVFGVVVALLASTAGAVDRGGDVGDRVEVAADGGADGVRGRLLLLGDSQALRLAMPAPPEVAGFTLAGNAVLGCGIGPGIAAMDGEPVERGGDDSACEGLVDEWVALIERDDPDVVMLHAGAWDVLDRMLDGRLVPFGTAEWDALTAESLRGVLERLGAGGTEVVALTAPCFAPLGEDGGPSVRGEQARVDRWNDHLREAAARTGATVLEYGALLCPGGTYRTSIEGTVVRDDGVHLTEPGAALAWRWLEAELVRVGPG